MPYGKFFLCNLAGATVWAAVMVSLAFFLGQIVPLEQLATSVAKFGIFALVIFSAWILVPLWLESRQVDKVNSEE